MTIETSRTIVKIPPVAEPSSHRWIRSNYWIGSCIRSGLGLSTAAIIANTIYGCPIHLPYRRTFDRIAIRVQAGVAGGARLGIYADTGDVTPGNLILDAGIVDVTAVGHKEIVISQTLGPGLIWTAMVSDVAPTLWWYAPGGAYTAQGQSSVLSAAAMGMVSGALAYGPLPATFPAIAAGYSNAIVVALRG